MVWTGLEVHSISLNVTASVSLLPGHQQGELVFSDTGQCEALAAKEDIEKLGD